MDNLKVYLSTWNVATNFPHQDLNSLLGFPSVPNKSRPLPDLYMMGFQEVKSQPQNRVMDALFSDPWTTAVSKILHKHDYIRVKSIRLQGLVLLVFSLRKHLVHLRDIETQYTKTGFAGMWGNKGAVSIRWNIYGCSVCIVNAHLTPHDHLLDERVADYNNIIKSNIFHVRDTSNIMYHDYVFWLGDLNFRLSEKMSDSPESISERIKGAEKDDYSSLLDNDQLRMVMATGDAFSELKETLPRFPPTYKFEIGSNEYDTKRRPAWTDRILYKVVADNYENVTLRAEQLNYHSLPQYTVSDHKPVVSEFNIKVFSNYTERCVEFAPIKDIWYIGDAGFVTKFTLSPDIQIYPSDWIAIFEADFVSLEDYKTYEYVNKVGSLIPSVSDSRTIVFNFPVGSGVRTPGYYKFIYFSQPMSEVRSVLGMSESFEVRESDNEDSVTQHTVHNSASSMDASSSSSGGQSGDQEGTTMDSLLKDLTGLQFPGLNFNVLNDLSID